jgi:DNA-binding transcriptional MerR regulator
VPTKDQPVYSMNVARELTGLSERQIRYYDSMGLVCPRRTPGGHRLYSEREIERLGIVARLLNRGMTISQVSQRLAALDAKLRPEAGDGDAHFRTMRPQLTSYPSYPLNTRPDDRRDGPPRVKPGEVKPK